MNTISWIKSVTVEYWDEKTQVIVDRDIIYQIDGLLDAVSADERIKFIKMFNEDE